MKIRNPVPIQCFLIFFSLSVLSGNCKGQTVMLTKKQAEEDFRWVRFALEYVHPRLYKYEDKATVTARFDSLSGLIHDKISGMDFLSLVTRANASIRCGHLYTIPQDKLAMEVIEKKVLPFHVKILGEKIYLLYDCSNTSIPNGSQILSINGKSDKQLLDAMLPGIAADGYIHTRKLRLLERYFYYSFHGFDLYYQLFVDRSDTFKIDYLEYQTNIKKTATLRGISIKERQKLLLTRHRVDEESWFKTASPRFDIDVPNNYAILTVSRSFYDSKIDPNFDSLLAAAFHRIKENEIGNLILDVRNNEGGSEHQQMELMSYLYNQPFRLYQNIYLSHLDFRPLKSIILERDTSSLLFNNDDEFMRKINDDLWISNYEYGENLQLKPPKQNVFTGNLYVLMNGLCFSSAADLVSGLKKTTAATFIGEEAGGTYEGPTGGDAIVIQLPNSKIMVRISPNIQIGYLYQKHVNGRGVIPTYSISYTIDDILTGRDVDLEFAKKLIQNKKLQ